ncbi:metallophosphoesterase family protein [Neobacillus sp. NPDC097160]|uniref:metallophosphoesterase family protein n=1 Tax=Neobacillus sp. NPDC097160 TaxID=3364298 RepID=UPI0038137E5B
MRIAFISDIHGNANALDAVLKDLKVKEVDKIFVLGDLCFRGPEPKRSLELVRSLNTEVIKGNADEWVVRGINVGEVPESAIEMMSIEREWTFSQLDKNDINYLSNLPTELILEFEKVKIHAFHATPKSLFEVVQPSENDEVLKEKLMVRESDIYIYAHIHKPFIRYLDGKCIINIGSIGLPFDGLGKSSYALVEIKDETFQTTIVRVNYDVEGTINKFCESDYPNYEHMIRVLLNAKI